MDRPLDLAEVPDLSEPTPAELVACLGSLGEELRANRRFDLVAKVSALFFQPTLQSNTLRIESLAHTAMAIADRAGHLSTDVAKFFNAVQRTRLSRLEDPSENVMTAQVVFQNRSFLLLNGIWESNSTILQRCLTVVETMPDRDGFDTLKNCIYSLLALVDETCLRNNLRRHEIGNASPVASVNANDLPSPDIVVFTRKNLEQMHVDADSLRPFIVREEWIPRQGSTPTSNSLLHRFPLIRDGDSWVLAMPASVPIAIREFLAEVAVGNGLVADLADSLLAATIDLIKAERIFGIPPDHPLVFRNSGAGPVAECVSASGSGEAIQILFLGDDLEDISVTRTVGHRPLRAIASSEITQRISRCASKFRERARPGFGMTLIVDSGIGRAVRLPPIAPSQKEWCVEHCSLEDLLCLNRLDGFDAFDLVKILQGKQKAEELGVTFDNNIGIATLVAWVRANEGHVVRSGNLPGDLRNRNFTLAIAPRFIKQIRIEAARSCDIRGAKHVDGSARLVRAFAKTHFAEDALRETYTPVAFDVSEPSVVYFADDHCWWFTLALSEPTPLMYERLEMLRTWIGRLARTISEYCNLASIGATEVKFYFSDQSRLDGFLPPETLPTVDEIQHEIVVSTNRTVRTVELSVGPKFEVGTASPTNISEVALLRQIVRGIAELPGIDIAEDRVIDLVDAIVGGPDGRHLHGLVEHSYRDRFCAMIRDKVIKPHPIDNCNLRLGLAFQVESRSGGRKKLRSKRTCTQLLNKTVAYLEDELCRQLRHFDRENVVRTTLTNYEAALFQRERWERTAHANIALQEDKRLATQTIVEQIGLLDGVIQPSRLLVEVAICECPSTGGKRIGSGDLSRLLTLVSAICTLGGWSDAIHMHAMPPALEITPLGDILADTKFEQTILAPFHAVATERRVDHSIENRAKLYASTPDAKTPDAPCFEPAFRNAVREELGLDIEDVIFLADKVIEIGFRRDKLMFEISRTDLQAELALGGSPEIAARLIDAFIFRQRDGWRNLRQNEDARNLQLWRLRRMLSLLRYPIIELAPGRLLVSPGLVETAVMYVMRSFYEGSYRDRDLKSKAMINWRSKANNQRGKRFALRVAAKLSELGWVTASKGKSWVEVQMTEILAGKEGKQFGDVDVIAYHPPSCRVLCVECKALHFHKTHGEVAEQLSDYRGELKRDGKTRDDLMKHLERIDLLRKNTNKLARFVKAKSTIVLEPLLIFENPVPILFAWQGRLGQDEIATFAELAERYDVSGCTPSQES